MNEFSENLTMTMIMSSSTLFFYSAILVLTACCLPLARGSDVVELNAHNFKSLTDGKTIFVKFCVKNCGHCKEIAPAWEKLGKAWADSEVGLIGQVDCDVETELCDEHKVNGTPTLLFGPPESLVEYGDSHSYRSLSKFAKEELIPICVPSNPEACSDSDRKLLDSLMSMTFKEVEQKVNELEQKQRDAKKEFDREMNHLQGVYDMLSTVKESKVIKIKTEIKHLQSLMGDKK